MPQDIDNVTVKAARVIDWVGVLILGIVVVFGWYLTAQAGELSSKIEKNAQAIKENARTVQKITQVQAQQTQQINQLIKVIEKAADSAQENRETLIKIATKLEVGNGNQ